LKARLHYFYQKHEK